MQNQKPAKKHHFISKFYLKRFTPLSTLDSSFFVLNLEKRKYFSQIPANVATQKNFNKIDTISVSPLILESELLCDFEACADKAIANIEVTGKFEGEDRAIILNLLTLFAVRSPYRREAWEDVQTDLANHILSLSDLMIEKMPEGSYLNSMLITQELKDSIGNCKVDKVMIPRNQHIEMELQAASSLIPGMFERKWLLVRAPADLDFVTCDFPVSLAWKDESKHRAPPGFDSSGTRVSFPLTKKLALIGEFEGEGGVVNSTDKFIAALNSITLASAKRWAYAPTLNFYFMKSFDTIAYGLENFWRALE